MGKKNPPKPKPKKNEALKSPEKEKHVPQIVSEELWNLYDEETTSNGESESPKAK